MSHGPNKREKSLIIFAIFLGGVVAVYLLNYLYGQSTTALLRNRDRTIKTNTQYENTINRLPATEARLMELTERSLPLHDRRASSSRYQNWLIGIVDQSGLQNRSVDPLAVREVKKGPTLQYCVFSYTIRGRCSLAQASGLLRRFYEVDHCHMITSLSLKPLQNNTTTIDFSMEVSTIGLPQTPPSDTLVMNKKETSIAQSEIDSIVSRALFSNYSAPRPQPQQQTRTTQEPPAPPAFDIRPYCYLNAITDINGIREAWIDIRTNGTRLYVKKGDQFMLGTVQVIVLNINDDSIDVEAGRARIKCRIHFGQTFADAELLEDA